jgi:hypothetical protein
MKTKPFSVRFSEKLTALINRQAGNDGKTPTDVIRESMEKNMLPCNNYRSQYVDYLISPSSTIDGVINAVERNRRDKKITLDSLITRHEISALMVFWHQAYLISVNGFANPKYVSILLDIMNDLFVEATKQSIEIDTRHLLSKLGIAPEDNFSEKISDIKKQFTQTPSISWAEMLTRPLEMFADKLDQYSRASISSIFLERLSALIPITVHYARKLKNSSRTNDFEKWINAEISQDELACLPKPLNIVLSNINFRVMPEKLLFSGENTSHFYTFKRQSLIALLTAVEYGDNAVSIEKPSNFASQTIQIFAGHTHQDNQVMINENDGNGGFGGYSLYLTNQEFIELKERLSLLLTDHKWVWLLNRYTNLMGDI